MILVYAIIILIILALIFRRDLSAIGRLRFRGGWSLALAVLGLFVLQAGVVIFVPGLDAWKMWLLLISQLALVALLFLNRHISGTTLFALGIGLNTLVMAANSGWMPVTPDMYQFVHPDGVVEPYTRPPASKNVILRYEETSLWILSDIIPITLPWRRNAISIGDVFLIVGAAQFIFLATQRKNEEGNIKQIEGSHPSKGDISP